MPEDNQDEDDFSEDDLDAFSGADIDNEGAVERALGKSGSSGGQEADGKEKERKLPTISPKQLLAKLKPDNLKQGIKNIPDSRNKLIVTFLTIFLLLEAYALLAVPDRYPSGQIVVNQPSRYENETVYLRSQLLKTKRPPDWHIVETQGVNYTAKGLVRKTERRFEPGDFIFIKAESHLIGSDSQERYVNVIDHHLRPEKKHMLIFLLSLLALPLIGWSLWHNKRIIGRGVQH